jgi:c(7)-type cytochrome triheme protein
MRRELRVGAFAFGVLALAGTMAGTVHGMPDSVRIPPVKPHPQGAPKDPALFRHDRHDNFTCATCHPAMFPMWRAGFTHVDMNDGRFCGQCHDGDAASDISDLQCTTCHVPSQDAGKRKKKKKK